MPPRLNAFGAAFQANHFRWPGGDPPAHHTDLKSFPISGLATFSSYDYLTGRKTTTDFNQLELFASDGFTLGGKDMSGGYFVDYIAAVRAGQGGDLDYAFVSVPLAGKHGQLALTAGQFAPMTYQYDPINSLTQSLPAALASGVDGFTFTDANPGLRLEYYDKRGSDTADGNYVSVGVPFEGHITLNSQSQLDSTTHGAYVHAFQRKGEDSVGVFGYARSGNNEEGVIGTKDVGEDLHLMGIGVLGHDFLGSTNRISAQAEYVVNPSLAFTGRLETVEGQGQGRLTYPVTTVTYYPFSLKVIRLTGEMIQAKGNRSIALYLLGQF